MEIREFAERILRSDSLPEKLQRLSGEPTDANPGDAWRPEAPARSSNLQFAPRRTAPAMPRGEAFRDPTKRGIAHHIMANHELQALEVMAFVLCAFPDAPPAFRKGMVAIMHDEQRHTRMHADRSAELDVPFGSLPVNCYIWVKAQSFQSPLDYIAGLPLTFEGRNLDHTQEFEQEFLAAGDEHSAAIVRAIHRDEIGHVAFGVEWLRKLKPPDQSEWQAFESHLQWPLRPSKAKGDTFDRQSRLATGMSPDFIDHLESAED